MRAQREANATISSRGILKDATISSRGILKAVWEKVK
jgi:hypothetical protein